MSLTARGDARPRFRAAAAPGRADALNRDSPKEGLSHDTHRFHVVLHRSPGRDRRRRWPLLLFAIVVSSTWIIRENESGLVIKKYGPALAAGRLDRARRRGGLPGAPAAARLALRPVPLAVPRRQGADGRGAGRARSRWSSPPTARRSRPSACSAREIACDNFQDAEAFLRGGGERGRQLGFLTAGTYRINPALFQLVTARNAEHHGMTPEHDLCVRQIPTDTVGIVTTLDGRPIPAGDLAGPPTKGHDSFQRGQHFIEAGGCRGLQEEVLLAGSWNLNPWFVQVELTPMLQIPIGSVGVVVSYVGKEHVDVSGDGVQARRSGRARRQGRVGRAAAARQAPAQPARDEGGAGADDQHRPQLGGADGGARVRQQPVVDPRALEGRVLVQPRRRAGDPHRREDGAARDLARRVDAEPGRPRAAADGRATTSATRRRR